jgi:hypothetical protein
MEGCEGATSLSAISQLTKVTFLNLNRCSAISGLRHLTGAHSSHCCFHFKNMLLCHVWQQGVLPGKCVKSLLYECSTLPH